MQSFIDIELTENDTHLVINEIGLNFQSVISLIGGQSTGKSSFLNGVNNGEKVSEVGVFQTTTGAQGIVVDGDNLIIDSEGHMSPEKLQKYTEETGDRLLGKKLAKNASKKLGTALFAISDAVVCCIRGGSLQSPHFIDALHNIQSQDALKNINYPILFIVCINDLRISDENLKQKIECIMGSVVDMVNNFTEMHVEIVPYLDTSEASIANHSTICKNIFTKIVTRIKFYRDFPTSSKMKIPLSTNAEHRLGYLREIVDAIDTNRGLMSFARYTDVINAELYHELSEEVSELIKNVKENFPYKLLKIDDIKRDFIAKYRLVAYENCAQVYIDKFSQWLYEIVEINNTSIKENVKSHLESVDDIIRIMYEKNLIRCQAITNKKHQELFDECHKIFTRTVIDIQPELTNNSNWAINVSELYVSYYIACHEKCRSGHHLCSVGGVHTTHNFESNVYEISCEKNCGYKQKINCDNPKTIQLCPGNKLIYCTGGCGRVKNVDCSNNTSYYCGTVMKLDCGHRENGCNQYKTYLCGEKTYTWYCGRTSIQKCKGCGDITGSKNPCYELNALGVCKKIIWKSCDKCGGDSHQVPCHLKHNPWSHGHDCLRLKNQRLAVNKEVCGARNILNDPKSEPWRKWQAKQILSYHDLDG